VTIWPATAVDKPAAGLADRRAALFTPGPRLGWVFRDRRQLVPPYPELPPDLESMRAVAAERAESAHTSYRKIRKWLGMPSTIVLVLLLLADGCQANLSGTGPPIATDTFVLIICSPGIVITYLRWQRWRQAAAAIDRAGDDHQRALAAWQQGENAWQQAELAKLADATEWGSTGLPEGTLRADVFGGSLRSWQALLTTHGTSLLASQPLLAVDLSGELACEELTELARAAGVPTATWLLPAQLGASGLLAGLTAAQFADALAEAVHAGPEPGNARAARAVDTRVLEQMHGALGGNVTPARLAAAVRAALGHADQATPLTQAEQTLITAELFPAAYRRQIEPNLVRIEAFLTDLAQQAGPPGAGPRPPAYFTCLALEPAARSARAEMLAALAIQWLTVQVTSSTEPAPAVIICGADEITGAHLERLAGACERRRVPLTLMFRHLRDAGLGILGGGATAFMRMGNHTEARQAADYIGRQHTFVLSQLTATDGGSRTHTTTQTEGHTVTDTLGSGWHTGWTTSSSTAPGTSSESESGGSNRSQGRSVSRTWSTSWSQAQGTTWSNAAATQRVYEYAVEPAVLQNLPDHALLLVTRGPGGPALQPVECDPAIITLPRVSTMPLQDPATPTGPGPGRTEPSGAGAAHDSWPAWGRQPHPDDQAELPQIPPRGTPSPPNT
jgi:hypothetical protein